MGVIILVGFQVYKSCLLDVFETMGLFNCSTSNLLLDRTSFYYDYSGELRRTVNYILLKCYSFSLYTVTLLHVSCA